MKITEVGKVLGKEWKELSESEKEKYNKEATALKEKYVKEMEAWRARKYETEDNANE